MSRANQKRIPGWGTADADAKSPWGAQAHVGGTEEAEQTGREVRGVSSNVGAGPPRPR